MSLSPGSSVGPYQIVGSLGAGGMGEVYRARDTRLNRDVAIKTLPASVAMDRDRAERFDREARLLAALNHPHIAGIHGVEHSGGVMCLVLELVEGQSLAARISGTPLPVDEALRLARQIADALVAAHDRGIIHRDLKPANVMLTADGQVKVLDFGLGKVVEPDSSKDVSNSPTMSLGGTQVGMLLGTAAYMSPEQAKGLPADKRSDVWAFGCVLFEMLTGARAFHGDDVSETLAAVLKSEPGWGVLPADVPPAVRALLESCLEKSRRTRLADLSAALFVIDRHQSLGAGPAGGVDWSAAGGRAPFWRRVIPLAATAVAVATLVSAWWWAARPVPVPPRVTRLIVPLTEAQAFTSSARRLVAISPDGAQVVFGGATQLYLRRLGDWTAQAIPGTDGTPVGPVFSPDGRQLAFWNPSDRTLKRVAVEGGAPASIHPLPAPPLGIRWTETGLILGRGPEGVFRISDRGEVTQLIKLEAPEAATDPQLLPHGRHLLVTIGAEASTLPDNWDKTRVVVYDLDTGTNTVVRNGASGARYVSSGHLIYAMGGTLFAAPFDLETLRETGPSVAVVEGVRRGITGVVHYDVSPTGVLTYVPGPSGTSVMAGGIGFTDRSGTIEALKFQPGAYNNPRVSPDGRAITFELTQSGETSVWVYALGAGTSMRRLTLTGRNRYPIWSHDSQRVAFQSDREGDAGIFIQRADGTGVVTRLTKAEAGVSHMPEAFSPDGAHLLFSQIKGAEAALWVLSVKDGRSEPFGNAKGTRPMTADFHPSGKWVAYGSDAGRQEGFVFVQPFPATGEVHQVSQGGENGHHPKWTPDGKELLYIPQVGRFVSVTVSTAPTFTFTDPKSIPRRFAVSSPLSARPWDIGRDGRVISLLDSIQGAAPEVRIVLNWFEELRARVPVK